MLIRSCLVYRGRAIPLAWRAVRHKSTQVSFEAYQPVLDQLGAILPEGHRITLLADRGFVHECLIQYLQKRETAFSLAVEGQHPGSSAGPADLCRKTRSVHPALESHFFQEVSILGAAVGPVHLALTCLLEQPDDRLYRGE